ncbi:MAG: ribonuclease, partial [Pseudomonadota bacterium]
MKTKIESSQESAGLLSEFKGTVLGHRDGHGFVQRDDGGADVYLAMNEMRAVLHGDSVLVRIQRLDRKGRPEGHVLDILDRPERSIIGRLLNEGGVWVVAPEDKRYGQDILIPKLTKAQADEW